MTIKDKNLYEVIKTDFQSKIKVTEIEELPDGGAKVFFDVDEDFIEWFKQAEGLKRWSRKRFETVLNEAIERLINEKLQS